MGLKYLLDQIRRSDEEGSRLHKKSKHFLNETR